jgi:hypothetical protein
MLHVPEAVLRENAMVSIRTDILWVIEPIEQYREENTYVALAGNSTRPSSL